MNGTLITSPEPASFRAGSKQIVRIVVRHRQSKQKADRGETEARLSAIDLHPSNLFDQPPHLIVASLDDLSDPTEYAQGTGTAFETGRVGSVFGELVERHRGGIGGGGSEITDTATRLLNQYKRLQVALAATAQVSETVLDPTADPDPDSTSARNQLSGTVTGIEQGETVFTVYIDVDGTVFQALVTEDSIDRLGLVEGREVIVMWKTTATRLAHEI